MEEDMKKMILALTMVLLLTGCTRRMVDGALSSVKVHKMDSGVVCYTFATSISCVKVTP